MHGTGIDFQFNSGHKCALATQTVCDPQRAERLKCLARRHPADAQLGRKLLLRIQRVPLLEPPRPDLPEQVLTDLEIKRDDTIAIDAEWNQIQNPSCLDNQMCTLPLRWKACQHF